MLMCQYLVSMFVLHSCNIKVLEVYAMASQLQMQLQLHFVIISTSQHNRNRIKNPDRNCCYCVGFFDYTFLLVSYLHVCDEHDSKLQSTTIISWFWRFLK